MSSTASWKQALNGQCPSYLADEIDIFETQIALKQQGKIDDKVGRIQDARRLMRGMSDVFTALMNELGQYRDQANT